MPGHMKKKSTKKNGDHSNVTPAKARKILKDGMVHGKRLTAAQKRMFEMIAKKKTKKKTARKR